MSLNHRLCQPQVSHSRSPFPPKAPTSFAPQKDVLLCCTNLHTRLLLSLSRVCVVSPHTLCAIPYPSTPSSNPQAAHLIVYEGLNIFPEDCGNGHTEGFGLRTISGQAMTLHPFSKKRTSLSTLLFQSHLNANNFSLPATWSGLASFPRQQ